MRARVCGCICACYFHAAAVIICTCVRPKGLYTVVYGRGEYTQFYTAATLHTCIAHIPLHPSFYTPVPSSRVALSLFCSQLSAAPPDAATAGCRLYWPAGGGAAGARRGPRGDRRRRCVIGRQVMLAGFRCVMGRQAQGECGPAATNGGGACAERRVWGRERQRRRRDSQKSGTIADS